MGLPAASGVGFAIAGGAPAELSGLLHIQPPSRRGFGHRRLFVSVEPLQPTERGREVAAAALHALRDGFTAAADRPVANALGAAFAAANAAVREENRLRPSDGPERRVFVGATAIVLEGRVLTVAQVPPTQAAIVQDGSVYAFPAFASWTSRYQPDFERLGPDAEPLGRAEQATVDLYRTLASPGDLIFLCASAIPIAIARTDLAGMSEPAFPQPLTDLQAALQPGDPGRLIDHLDGVIERHDLDDVHAACVTVGRLHSLDARYVRETAARMGLACGLMRPAARPAMVGRGQSGRPRRRSPRRLQAGVSRHSDYPDPADEPGGAWQMSFLASDRGRPPWLRAGRTCRVSPVAPLLRLHQETLVKESGLDLGEVALESQRPEGAIAASLGVRMSDDAVLPGRIIPISLERRDFPPPLPPVPLLEVWQHAAIAARAQARTAASRPMDDAPPPVALVERIHVAAMMLTERVAPPRPERPVSRSSRAAPGVLSMQRHRPGLDLGLSSDWRSRLPRASFGPAARPVLIAILAILIVLSTAGYVREFVLPDREAATIAAHLAAVDMHVVAAERTGNTVIVTRELVAAADALSLAADAGASAAAIESGRQRVGIAHDRANGIMRLGDGERIGGLPAAPQGGYRLAQADGDVYLTGGTLYRFDRDGRRLVRVLAPGDLLGESTVGPLYHASFDDGALVATDGVAAYTHDLAGEWSASALNPEEGAVGNLATAPSAGFDEHLYVLDVASGRILKFDVNDPTAPPLDWAGGAEQEELRSARDIVVDGSIHVLLDDGRVLTFYRGTLERTYDPPSGRDLHYPVALAPSTDGSALFVVYAGGVATPGHIFRLDLGTEDVRELVAEPIDGTSPLMGVTDVLVDETTGIVHLVTAKELWRFSLPR